MSSVPSKEPRRWLSLGLAALLCVGFLGIGNIVASGQPLSTSAIDPVHILRPATAHSAAQVEVFLNGTGSTTWQPNEVSVPAGANVTFVVGIVGDESHNFTLDSISNDTNLSTSWSPDQVFGYFNGHNYLVKMNSLNLSGPATVSRPIAMPAHGVFEFICEVPGHFQTNMYGHVYDGVPAPSQSSSEVTLNYIEIDVLGLSSLAVIVVIALFIVYSGRGPKPLPKADPDDLAEEPAPDAPH